MPISPSAREVLMGAIIDIADEAFDHRIERIPAVRASSWRGSNFERTVRLQAVFFEEQFARLEAHAQSLIPVDCRDLNIPRHGMGVAQASFRA